ncbi:putative zinc finger protein [Chitinophaga niastensis]|uniref:Putative zinc finger protein n=1 Tax=Chitinophaga niastensis TaxID=536980 RepID=A0A2P8HIW6_CHINA|nr:zf-HC2 domain-containing protein [Chitinophaga niastensis]PSL46166.1 putative zinc finger protein [Chitinophaga niastensis]
MLSSKPNNEKVLKVFSPIRCLSKDQLPRYLEGRLTDVEKHLVEQHLTDCDLCFNALQALEQEGGTEKYQDLTNKLQRYVHESIQPVSHIQKVAQYTRKEKNKENLLVYFWLVAFIGMAIGSVYVLRGHLRNQPVVNKVMAAATPAKDSQQITVTPQQPIVTENHTPATTPTVTQKPAPPVTPAATAAVTKKADSLAIIKAAKAKALQKKAAADSIARKQYAIQKQDSLKKAAADKNKESEKKTDDTPVTKQVTKDQAPPEPVKKETAPVPVNSDEYLYKAAMVYQQQGNLSEAIDRYRRIESVSAGKYVEMARYQLAICYRSKGQMGKARRMFREVVRMDGSLKNAAQQALDSM